MSDHDRLSGSDNPAVMSALAGISGLSSAVGLIVPSTNSIDRPVSDREVNERLLSAEMLISDLFGGSTSLESLALPGSGRWRDPNGRVVGERVYIVFTFCPSVLASDWAQLVKAAAGLCRLWGQEVVGLIGPSGYSEVDQYGRVVDYALEGGAIK